MLLVADLEDRNFEVGFEVLTVLERTAQSGVQFSVAAYAAAPARGKYAANRGCKRNALRIELRGGVVVVVQRDLALGANGGIRRLRL